MCLSGADNTESRKALTEGVMAQYKDMCQHCVITCDTVGPVATVTNGSEFSACHSLVDSLFFILGWGKWGYPPIPPGLFAM